jgi:predicted Zn-dependent peptidase
MKANRLAARILIILMVSIPLNAEIKKTVLKNNTTLITDADSSSQTTIIQICIKGGKGAEPLSKAGLAYLTTRLSIDLPDSQKRKRILEMASKFESRITTHFCLITISCLSEHTADTLEIFSDVFSKPLISALRISRFKNHMKYLQKSEKDRDLEQVSQTLRAQFIKSPEFHGSVFGTSESLKQIKRDDIIRFYRNYFNGSHITVAASSSLPESALIDLLTRCLDRLPTGSPVNLIPWKMKPPDKRDIHIFRQKTQFLIARGTVSPEINPVNFPRVFLLESLLGKGIGSELWTLRETDQLAYLVDSHSDITLHGGIFFVYLKTNPEQWILARQKFARLMTSLVSDALSPDSFEAHKNYAAADFFRLVESKKMRTFYLAYFESFGPGYDYLGRIPAILKHIQLDDFLPFLQQILSPDKQINFTIGPTRQPDTASRKPQASATVW